MTGASRLLVDGAPALLDEVGRAGARFLVVADGVGPVRSTALEDSLVRAGASVVRLDLRDPAATENRVREAVERPGAVLVALSPCVRNLPRAVPLVVEASLCNRCGACLSLACPAISDAGRGVGRRRSGRLHRVRALRAPLPVAGPPPGRVAPGYTPKGHPRSGDLAAPGVP